ncbi:MAG: [Clostridia bacterium]|nr:[FeFe] hydrogenase H-cluster maturation GTPase HydF [Clostridia bacterium]
MSLNSTPSADRVHIAFFGRRNAGKSSLLNAVTGQDIAVVSEIGGTTTDPVYKAMELLPLGPVMMIDTPGYDDEGSLGEKRVGKTREILRKTDIAVLVADPSVGIGPVEEELAALFAERGVPHVTVFTKADEAARAVPDGALSVSSVTGEGIEKLKNKLAEMKSDPPSPYPIVSDLVAPGDAVVLVIPIDKAAPKGRLILPQQQTIRELLDAGCSAVCVRDAEYAETLKAFPAPSLVICDSQVFGKTAEATPEDIRLTSFSVLMARHKGILFDAVRGVLALDRLKTGDRVLISEGCTHHRQCDDIGSVKLPRMIKGFTGADLSFEFTSGGGFPDDVSGYSLVLHCGGCMLNGREMIWRMKKCESQGVPFTNYGVAIARMNGILKRAVGVFPQLEKETEKM